VGLEADPTGVLAGEGDLQPVVSQVLGEAVPLDKEGMRMAAGRDADARAFLVLRPYMKRGLKVAVTDPADPTPYWLFHTRNPDTLAAVLTKANSR
jgi:hypothetical protein